MEGYLIRIPGEACVSDPRPAWGGQGGGDDSDGPVYSRALYYVLEGGELCGYASPEDAQPLETFQLTSHRVDVNVMYSMNIFELSGRTVPVQTTAPPRHVVDPFAVDDTSSSDSSSDDDDTHAAQQLALQAAQSELCMPHVDASSLKRESFTGDFRVIFFAANKELVKTWSTKLLNWNRHVFETSEVVAGESPAALQQAKDDVVQALDSINAKSMFLRLVELRIPHESMSESVGRPCVPLDMSPAPANCPPTPVSSVLVSIVVKPRDPDAPTSSTPWWLLPFSRYKRVSAYSFRR